MSYSFSISFDKEIYRKWPQELPGLFPIDFALVFKGNGWKSFQAHFLLIL